jgi:hypothetical protein
MNADPYGLGSPILLSCQEKQVILQCKNKKLYGTKLNCDGKAGSGSRIHIEVKCCIRIRLRYTDTGNNNFKMMSFLSGLDPGSTGFVDPDPERQKKT